MKIEPINEDCARNIGFVPSLHSQFGDIVISALITTKISQHTIGKITLNL